MLQPRWCFGEATKESTQLVVLLFFFSWIAFTAGTLKANEKAKFAEFDVFPGVTMLPPKDILKVSYHYKNVNLGNHLQIYEVMDAPVFLQWPREIGAYYILFLLGPDVPTSKRPYLKHSQHWVIANIPGNRLDDGDTLVEYVGLTHHYLAGPHRFVFIVFKQPYNFTMQFEIPRLSKGLVGKERLNFSFQNFVDKYYLEGPIASNFYRVFTR